MSFNNQNPEVSQPVILRLGSDAPGPEILSEAKDDIAVHDR